MPEVKKKTISEKTKKTNKNIVKLCKKNPKDCIKFFKTIKMMSKILRLKNTFNDEDINNFIKKIHNKSTIKKLKNKNLL